MTHAAADSSSRGSTTDVRGLGVGQDLGPVVHDVHVEVDDFEGAHQEHHERAVDYPCRQGGRRVLANWRTKNVKRESDCLACWNEGVSWAECDNTGPQAGLLTMYVTKGEQSRNR